MIIVNPAEFEARFNELCQAVQAGQLVVIESHGTRIALALAPPTPAPESEPKPTREWKLGALAGRVRMADDFDAPMMLVDDPVFKPVWRRSYLPIKRHCGYQIASGLIVGLIASAFLLFVYVRNWSLGTN